MEGRRLPEPVPDLDVGDSDASWNEILRLLDEHHDPPRLLNLRYNDQPPPASVSPPDQQPPATSLSSDRISLASTAAAGSVSRLGAEVSEGFGVPSAQQLGFFAPQMFSSRQGADEDQSVTAWATLYRPAISDSPRTRGDVLQRVSQNQNLFRPTPHELYLPSSLAVTSQFQQPHYLAENPGGLPEWSSHLPSAGFQVSADRSDLVLPDTPTSSASSEGETSSPEKSVEQATQAAVSREAQTSDKGKEEIKEEPPHSEEKGRGKLSRTKKPKKKRGPKLAIRTRCDVDIIDDGYKWRKYGQKAVKNSPFPRSYYKCTDKQCAVKKHVERQAEDPSFVVTTYEGVHNHPSPAPVPVVHRPIGNIPQVFPFHLPLQMGLFPLTQTNYNFFERFPDPERDTSESRRNQGLLEDVIPGELRRRSL